ncbi:TolC family protein [Ferrimonas lipolytica]|uniref:TolC family protein n=1 Tax=Ferrimonas lipolytica TaxID=2724191 RepID=A0A6H1UAU1_9GAMM|nr:TolC family protein [Ferrimonas lipolytica]QIZ75749.1 TolC family protein [Ferrimonas lipolytica]
MQYRLKATTLTLGMVIGLSAQATELNQFAHQTLAQLDALPAIQTAKQQLVLQQLGEGRADQALYNPELSFDVENIGSDSSDEDYTLAVSQSIDWADKRGVRTRLAQLQSMTAEAEYQQLRNDTLANLLQAQIQYGLATQLDNYAVKMIERTQASSTLAEKMVTAGELSPLDQQLLNLELAMAVSDRALSKQAMLEASTTVRLNGGEPQAKLSKLLVSNRLPSTEVNQTTPALAAAYRSVQAARAAKTLTEVDAKADPSISVGAVANSDETALQVGVSIPLQFRNRYQGEIAEATQAIVVAEQQFLSDQNNLSISLNSLAERYLAIADSRSQWQQLTQDSLQDSDMLMQKLWQSGELPTQLYLQSQQQLLDTAASGAELAAQQAMLWTQMMASRGELESWLIDQAN